ncbi:hypothetical protein [Vibrio phage vB_VmeM-Yong XC32]|nr:hypothetical protein [Vibrio phage vB_VmeM-Yong XC31]QAX96333.1 hypothetical protein [Vibrio phage vB_VmeM-Yong XC32]QAX96651.1 hypothetical protein [Vibrio phage vB_VmeM-Yong MS31]QAX96969.1 hypothetical protein [Vibrio phage vB_VmeM-Yong MS32]
MATKKIETVRRQLGFGSPESNAYNLFHGINHRGTGDLTPTNLDNHGYVFFTKPVLNLTTDNIRKVSKLYYLTSQDSNTNGTAIKCCLMPKREGDRYEPGNTRSAVIDDKSAFIPFLTNTLISFTGWPDEVTEFIDTDEGNAKEIHGHVDDRPENFGTFDLSATFVAKEGDPHIALFSAWREYMTRVAEGTTMTPFPEMIEYDEIDYMTRPYVLILGPDRKRIQKIAAAGAAVPKAVTTGASFNYNSEAVFSEENQQIDVPFKCYGAIYNDPALIDDFNWTVQQFNPDMEDSRRATSMVKLTPREKTFFNFYGYPRIEKETMELEWWLDFETYNALLLQLEDEGDV